MGVTDDYFKYQQEYEKKYGDRTVVLMQIGSFYEIYEYDPPLPQVKIGKASELSLILNVILTCKDKSKPHDLHNPKMIGFPCISYEKHRDVLLAHNYTIVKIDQEKRSDSVPKAHDSASCAGSTLPKAHDRLTRSVAEVLSPATEIENISTIPITNHIVSVYLECQRSLHKFEDYLMVCGISLIDVSTGQNQVCEVYSHDGNHIHALQEVYRFLTAQQPRELIINVNKVNNEDYTKYLYDYLELSRYSTVIIKANEINPEYLKITYQQQFLFKVFSPPQPMSNNVSRLKLKIQSKTNMIEELNLERMYYGCVSYISLLQYCYEHNEHIIQRLQKPETTWIDSDKHLILTHNAILQLNLLPQVRTSLFRAGEIPPGGIPAVDSLFSVINNTSTPLGKRYLRTMLLNPITDINQLESYYNMTDELITQNLSDDIEKYLKQLPDLERYQRKLHLRLIKPHELVILFRAYLVIVELYRMLLSQGLTHIKSLLLTNEEIADFNACLNYVLTLVDLEKLERCQIVDHHLEFTLSFLVPGQDAIADQYQDKLQTYDQTLQMICQHLNSFLHETRGKLIEFNFKSAPLAHDNDESESIGYLTTTNHKASVLKAHLQKIDVKLCGQISFSTIKQQTIITSDKIEQCGSALETTRSQLADHLLQVYHNLIAKVIEQHQFFNSLIRFISRLDFVKSHAKTSLKYQYYRPVIIKEAQRSFLKVKDLRHPIIERIIDTEYITNDVSLGHVTDDSQDPYGILLYGLNSAGKSSMTKAIASCIIMAQIGCYTPGKLTYYPYSKIITRLSGHDDLFKGQSSFVVEMSELRTALRNADPYSLVIGDELARGTESISSASLTIATILCLLERQSSFIFSSHLHMIPETAYIQQLRTDQLRICHLSTSYDEQHDTLVFDRKLKDQQGPTVYGIDVAKSLHLGPEFIKLANEIRRNLEGVGDQLLNTKKSKYNAKLYVDSCMLCGLKVNLETHHIRQQSEADDNGFIGHIPKNLRHNLMVICETCHTELHRNNLQIITKHISQGLMLEITDKL